MSSVPREESHPYFACPSCGIVGEPDSVDYALSADREHVDWTVPLKVSCGSCRSYSQITRTEVLDRDAEHTCSRCGHRAVCPARADRVCCRSCGLNEPGPAATGARAEHLGDVERAADQWAAARVRVAKDDARERGTLPWWTS
ncbi:MAG TPA: hypothetical protein VN520_13920 [Streptomyces sp.]|uniref:hypothetical protein n=1 Tax=Streptomyces sp. TaxID=1931 RepID=UPI002C2BF978|nr:hypothetical protein [Streptomyces sp.]HWU07453.1 hypothetical protein [Streptomyces sp.]